MVDAESWRHQTLPRHFTVHHPDYLVLPPTDDGNIAFVYDLASIPSLIDLNLVTSVDVLQPVPLS